MFRLTIKNLWANKIRFALTTFGVILAVSFVVSAFILGDGLRSSFTTVSKDVTAGIDLEVRHTSDLGTRPPIAADTVGVVAGVDGVAAASASLEAPENAVRPIRPDGESISTDGPPQLAFNWIDDARLSPFRLVDGAPPGIGQFTIDVDSAAKYGFSIGNTYQVMVPGGRVALMLSGTSNFGADNATLGAVVMQMNTAQAGQLFAVDGIDSVVVRIADGADATTVHAAIAAAVPRAEVVDHAKVLAETTSKYTDSIDLVGNILLGFGGLALFVSIFIIYNTFSIVLGQRTRELALLRTLGSDPRQIRRSVYGEALAVGSLASVGGIVGGIGVAKGLTALFAATGTKLSDYPLILAPRTIIAAAAIGIGVTLVAAIGPARSAATIPPIAALSGATEVSPGGAHTRKLAGLSLFGFGIGTGIVGLTGAGPTALTVAALASAAVAIFVGVTMLSPLAVRSVTRVVGWPMRATAGVTGALAQKNAVRNSRRTASTAAALMIGLALVTTALMVGSSIKSAFGSTFDRSAKADYYLTDQLDEVDFPATLVGELRESHVVSAATGFTRLPARVDGSVVDVIGFDFDQIASILDLGLTSGGFDTDVVNPVVVSEDRAKATGASIGDTIDIEVANGSRVDATVVGLFDDQTIVTEDYLLDNTVLASADVAPAPEWVAISIADGASPAEVDAMVHRLSNDFPYASVDTAAQFRTRVNGMVDQLLTIVNVMVALAVIIALIGIANTLALSVFERTRELGLIRAVGMTRRQLRRMVRFEAALVATFGATLGVALGVLFGCGIVAALPASLATGVTFPVTQIVVLMIVAAAAGVTAAWLPARRASRLDVLHAIAL